MRQKKVGWQRGEFLSETVMNFSDCVLDRRIHIIIIMLRWFLWCRNWCELQVMEWDENKESRV